MALPIDISELRQLAFEFKNESVSQCNINIYFDQTCDKKFANFVKLIFTQSSDSYFVNFIDWSSKDLSLEDDINLCIFVAGQDRYIPFAYRTLCDAGYLCLILTITPQTIVYDAHDQNIAINKDDVLCPSYNTYHFERDCPNPLIDFSVFTKDMSVSILDKIITWFLYLEDVDPILFASKIDFLKEPYCKMVIKKCSVKNAGIGAAGFIPTADMPVMTFNQAKMILQIATVYGHCSDTERILEVLTLSLSAFGLRYLSKKIKISTSIMPAFVNSAFGFGFSFLLGNIALTVFKEGGSIEEYLNKTKDFFSSALSKLLH